jgi:hypothetical protein
MGALEHQCLVLNRSWQAVNIITVQAALSMMAADAATGMNFTTEGYKHRITRNILSSEVYAQMFHGDFKNRPLIGSDTHFAPGRARTCNPVIRSHKVNSK